MPGTVYTVASGKGGVGKTTTALNLAVALWQEGHATALVDADLGMANLGAVLGLEPEVTLHDVLAGDADLEDAIVEAKDGDLVVLAGARELGGFASADPGALGGVIDDLADRYEYVVVDTGAGLSHEDVLPLGLADAVLLVTTADPAAVGDTKKTHQLAELLGTEVGGVVVTRATDGTEAERIAAEVGADLLGTIPEDAAVTETAAANTPLASHAPDAPATTAYRDLARSLASRAASAELDPDLAADEATNDAAEGTTDTADATAVVPDAEGTTTTGTADEPTAERDQDRDREATTTTSASASDGAADPVDGADNAEADADAAGDVIGDAAEDERSNSDDEEPVAPTETETGVEAESESESETESASEPEAQVEGGEPTDTDPEADAADTADESTGTTDREERRGGLTGWLGRLFS